MAVQGKLLSVAVGQVGVSELTAGLVHFDKDHATTQSSWK
jgi:hypothetical protein